MRKCCVCGSKITNPEPYVFFCSEISNEEMYGCDTCETQMTNLMEGQDVSSVKKAINYFYTYIDEVENKEVKAYLSDMVINNAEIVEELARKEEKKKPISERQKDYFENRREAENSTSGWISGLRFFAWISCIAIIVFGLFFGVPFLGNELGIGVAIILSSIIFGFLSVAVIIVFADMAEDVKCIKNHIQNKK